MGHGPGGALEPGRAVLAGSFASVKVRLSHLAETLTPVPADGKKKLHHSQHPLAVQNAELCLEMFQGIAASTDSKNHMIIAEFCMEIVSIAPQIADTYMEHQSVVLGLLEFLRDFSEAQINQLPQHLTNQLYEACGKVLKVYSDNHIGLVTVDSGSEEENFQDIMCILQLLTHLVSKDFVDYSSDHENGSPTTPVVNVSDVIFYGLEKVLPLMTENLLQFPTLCSNYFALVSFMLATYVDRLGALRPEVFASLADSLLYGARHPDAAVARGALNSLNELATFHARAAANGLPGLDAHRTHRPDLFLRPLQVLLEMAAFQGGVADRLDPAANALFALVVCERGGFEGLVGALLQRHQHDQATQAGLGAAFRGLVTDNGVSFQLDRLNRKRFRENLHKFVGEVRAFLSIH